MLSKKKLFETLNKVYNCTGYSLSHPNICNETYGRKSMVYVRAHSHPDRLALENILEAEGFKVNRDYDKGGNRTEVQVSYFRGHHWDE